VINELLASNSTVNQDADYNDYSDWIELFNPSDHPMDLSGYFISDDLNDTTKWEFPGDVSIESDGFIVVWADGKNESGSDLHSNFSLQKEGETIYLFTSAKELVDSVLYENQKTDISYGRQPDGGDSWYMFNTPTPGNSNISEIYYQTLPPDFSLEGGFYTDQQELELSSTEENSVIRYTLDGDEPDETSPIYTAPLQIRSRAGDPNIFSNIPTNADPYLWLPFWLPPNEEIFKATVVRARVFKEGYNPSEIISKTYFVDGDIYNRYSTIPVISLVSDYDHLFNDTTGIYVPGINHRTGSSGSGNYFQGWEKPAHIEFFEPGGNIGFAQDVGIRIQGGTSPASPQKGLHVIARSEYSENRIDYPLFENSESKASELTEYKRFIIRAWGSLISGAFFNDAYAHRLMVNSDLDLQAYRPAVVFINGEYWGLHELREANKNSWYYQFHYDINRDHPGFDILEHTERDGVPYANVDEGDNTHWVNMKNFINTRDLSLDENYEYVNSIIDIENFIAYVGHSTYVGNWDWPNNNEASWRPRTEDGRWRWITYDMEAGFGAATELGPLYNMLGVEFNMFKHAIEGVNIPGFGVYGPHPVLVRLLSNYDFKVSYINWFKDQLDAELSPEVTNKILNDVVEELLPYIDEYRKRWPFISDLNAAVNNPVNRIRSFNNQRSEIIRNQIKEYFNTDDDLQLTEHLLYQNIPNPFNNTSSIRYQLPAHGSVVIRIIDLNGKEVIRATRTHNSPGLFTFNLHADKLSNGMYFCVYETGNFTDQIKLMVIK